MAQIVIKEETTGREMILIIPGSSVMDRHQLQDILDKEKEVIREDLKAQGPIVKPRFSTKHVGAAIKELRAHQARLKMTGNGRYF